MFPIKSASLVLSYLVVGASAFLLITPACRSVHEATSSGAKSATKSAETRKPKRIFSRTLRPRTHYRYIRPGNGSQKSLDAALLKNGWKPAPESDRGAASPATPGAPAAGRPAAAGSPGSPAPSAPAAGVPSAPTTSGGRGASVDSRGTTGSDEFFMGASHRIAASDRYRVRRIFRRAQLPETSARWQRSEHRPSFARVYVGDGSSLELLRMRVTVTIEGPRARTVVDHVFQNPHDKPLEGTFEYPLPASASPCYYAMFLTPQRERVPDFFGDDAIGKIPPAVLVAMQPAQAMRKVDKNQWGVLREATVVPREKARQAYEEITRRKVDPALLEYAGGNTFRGRVFPIQASGLNRVVVSYEEHLDIADGRVLYRFPLPDCELELLDVTITVDGQMLTTDELRAGRDNKEVTRRVEKGTGCIVYHRAWGRGTKKTKGPGGELALEMTPADKRVQAITGTDPSAPAGSRRKQARTFYARLRPERPVTVDRPFADRGVFLLDTSFSEEPDRFHASLEILKQILESDTDLRYFNVACFDVRAAWVKRDGWIRNDERGRDMVFDKLRKVMLEGATDLSAVFDLLKSTRWRPSGAERRHGYVFLMTDGQLNWGERDTDTLARSLEDATLIRPRVFCYRTGISAENLELFEKLTRAGGGIFNVFTEAMAKKVGLAHRRPVFLLEGVEVAGAKDVLVAGRRASVFPGGEVVVAGRYDAGAKPTEVVLRGRFDGRQKVVRLPLVLGEAGTLADRAWAEIAVHQMLALGDPKIEPLAVAYAQRYHIGSRRTSFLVLETDADYRRFEIEKETSQLKVKDMASFLDACYHRRPEVPTRKDHWKAWLDKQQVPPGPAHELLACMHEQDLRLPAGSNVARTPTRSGASPDYLEARRSKQNLRDDMALFIREAKARAGKRDEQGCVRALSTVVETHPGRCDAMRLVGYRLLSWDQVGPAARLFDRVRTERPFEPHSYRDLARSLELSFHYPLAALQYEILLARKWDSRFGSSLYEVAHSEYQHLIAGALKSGSLSSDLIDWFKIRQAQLHKARNDRGQEILGDDVDLRVTISWNTDNTDVDLWVVEPDGTACGYQQPETHNGGRLLADLREGYGPERYQVKEALHGTYAVIVHHFSPNENLIAGETHVEVLVERRPGRRHAETRRFHVVLSKKDKAHEVCVVRFP